MPVLWIEKHDWNEKYGEEKNLRSYHLYLVYVLYNLFSSGYGFYVDQDVILATYILSKLHCCEENFYQVRKKTLVALKLSVNLQLTIV